MFVRMEQVGFQWTDFHENLCLSTFQKSLEKIQVWLEYDKNNGLYLKTYVHLWHYLAELFLEWEIFKTYLQKKSTPIL